MKRWAIRLAFEDDIPMLESLISESVHSILPAYYSAAQLDAALGPVFGVDQQLIRDRTYFIVGAAEEPVGCGGWSKRQAVYGGDRHRIGEDAELNPRTDAARIRAFFVRPAWIRQGVGQALLSICEKAIVDAGFARAEMVATLAGEPFYAAHGYSVVERYHAPMPRGLTLPVVKMTKQF